MENKKIASIALVLFIIAGIVVVLFRGFNVDLMLESHKRLDFVIGKDFEVSDVEKIAKEVFNKERTVIRVIELFDDSVSIDVRKVTDEELTKLIEKMNEKYSLEYKIEDFEIVDVPNVRIRDMVKPYILPCIITMIIVSILVGVHYRHSKEKFYVVLLKMYASLAVVELVLISIIAILRIPFNTAVIPVLLIIGCIEVAVFLEKHEKMLKELK